MFNKEKFIDLIDRRGLSVSEFVREMVRAGQDTSSQAVYNWINGANNPNLESIVVMARILKVKVDDLLVKD